MARDFYIFDRIAGERSDWRSKPHGLFYRIRDKGRVGADFIPLIRIVCEKFDDLPRYRNRRIEGWINIVAHQLGTGLVRKPTLRTDLKYALCPAAISQFFRTSVFQQEVTQRAQISKCLICSRVLCSKKIERRTSPFQHLLRTNGRG